MGSRTKLRATADGLKTYCHLDTLESEAVHIIRETAAEFERPALMFSGGKDSIVMLHLALNAFWPAPLPFGLLHVDTGHNFDEVLAFRDRAAARHRLRLTVAGVQEYIDDGRLHERPDGTRNPLQTRPRLDAIDANKPYLHHGKPIRRTERIVDADYSIVAQFQAEFRGVAQYYRLAFNHHRLGRLKYVMERSLVKTLARKYRIRAAQVYRRYRAVLETEHGPRRGLRAAVERDGGRAPLVAEWGGISLARDTTPRQINDDPPRIWSGRRSEVVQRLLAQACELCGYGVKVEVHHVRALKDLNLKGRQNPPEWVVRMASRRRKTPVVCRTCHEDIHAGHPKKRSRQ